MALGFNPNAFTPTRQVFRPGSSGFIVELKGLDKMIKTLDRRVLRMEQSILRQAVNAFAEPIREAAQRGARALISPRIVIGTNIRIRGTTAFVKVGPIGEFFWLFFWEYGYHIRATRKGPSITFISAKPTFRAAYDANKENGLAAMEKILFDAFSDEAIAA